MTVSGLFSTEEHESMDSWSNKNSGFRSTCQKRGGLHQAAVRENLAVPSLWPGRLLSLVEPRPLGLGALGQGRTTCEQVLSIVWIWRRNRSTGIVSDTLRP